MDIPGSSYLEKLAKKIDQEKQKANYKFVCVTSGTAYRINKEVVKKYPVEERQEILRRLIFEWTEGKQTLQGLRGIVTDQALIYKGFHDPEKIKIAVKSEFEYGIKYAIIHESLLPALENDLYGLTVLGYENCLFID